ncbi:cation acetate symporter, partial [Alienimonas chondri]
MQHEASLTAVVIFGLFVAGTLILSWWLGKRTKGASGYFAAHGQIPWFVNGVAFAGDYLSAASFLGICGMIAFYGYDGFLYSIGFLAGWVVALFVIAEPMKRLGKFTFADALDAKFNSKGIKIAAGLSTLAVSVFYLIPQMVGAGALVTPLLGLPHWAGVTLVGGVVIAIVTTAGMVSTTWVQFIKGGLLVVFSTILVGMVLWRGLNETGSPYPTTYAVSEDGSAVEISVSAPPWARIQPLGEDESMPLGRYTSSTAVPPEGSLGPVEYLRAFGEGEMMLPRTVDGPPPLESPNLDPDAAVITETPVAGRTLLTPGNHPKFADIKSDELLGKINFLSLMLALFCGTASLPHILIRYYTVKDAAAARKSTIVGIIVIGFFYVLTLFIGLGAMTSGALDPTDSNMAAPLLARTFGEWLFACISAVAFTTVLGTVSGLILASAGAVSHDLMTHGLGIEMDENQQVRVAKFASVAVGLIAIGLGIAFQGMNVSYLVGWAFSVAASANLPALVCILFWKGTTARGVIAGVTVGMLSSLAWILLSSDTFEKVYGLDPADALTPFTQPGLVTIPL